MNAGNHESIIISTDHKNALIFSLLLFIVLVAVKWCAIGYWLGKKGGCC